MGSNRSSFGNRSGAGAMSPKQNIALSAFGSFMDNLSKPAQSNSSFGSSRPAASGGPGNFSQTQQLGSTNRAGMNSFGNNSEPGGMSGAQNGASTGTGMGSSFGKPGQSNSSFGSSRPGASGGPGNFSPTQPSGNTNGAGRSSFGNNSGPGGMSPNQNGASTGNGMGSSFGKPGQSNSSFGSSRPGASGGPRGGMNSFGNNSGPGAGMSSFGNNSGPGSMPPTQNGASTGTGMGSFMGKPAQSSSSFGSSRPGASGGPGSFSPTQQTRSKNGAGMGANRSSFGNRSGPGASANFSPTQQVESSNGDKIISFFDKLLGNEKPEQNGVSTATGIGSTFGNMSKPAQSTSSPRQYPVTSPLLSDPTKAPSVEAARAALAVLNAYFDSLPATDSSFPNRGGMSSFMGGGTKQTNAPSGREIQTTSYSNNFGSPPGPRSPPGYNRF